MAVWAFVQRVPTSPLIATAMPPAATAMTARAMPYSARSCALSSFTSFLIRFIMGFSFPGFSRLLIRHRLPGELDVGGGESTLDGGVDCGLGVGPERADVAPDRDGDAAGGDRDDRQCDAVLGQVLARVV